MKATKHPQLRQWANSHFAWELSVRAAVLKMDKRQLTSLRRAVESRTTSNCWFGEYEILPFLRKLIGQRDETARLKKDLADRIRKARRDK